LTGPQGGRIVGMLSICLKHALKSRRRGGTIGNEDDRKVTGAAQPAGEARALSALDPRTRILRATTELLAEFGWNRTTTRKVAERAGVNNALVHYYFGTKRALLLQAATDVMFSQFGGAFEALEAGGDLGQGVRDAIAWLERSGPADAATRVVAELTLQAMHDPALRESLGSMLRDFRSGVAAMARDQGLDADAARGLAAVVAAVLDGLYLHALLDPALDLGAAAAALEPLFHREDA